MSVVTGITRRADVPHEPGQWLELRMLSWLDLDHARTARIKEIAERAKVLSGINFAALAVPQPQPVEDPLLNFDVQTLLRRGVSAWSYGDKVTTDDLDERTAQWAAREILALTLPDEGSLGKGSSRSTGTSPEPEVPQTNG